ncbi:hypothetical protein M0811_03735 [Anaeramoeba ignava]|uniref:Uncharacterized protein n=1 Tax=Anaeramoeba ignava TaxID=1746090 RepID=A0A9Q0LX62_ANAIG|nr:hypothetical protein M0811_03735 [Anaeramoeba ignava]
MKYLLSFLFSSFFLILSINSQLTPNKHLLFPIGINNPSVSFIDFETGFFYVVDYGSQSNSRIFKLELETLKVLDVLDTETSQIKKGVIISLITPSTLGYPQIDTLNQKLYFISDCENPSFSLITQIDLESFSVENNFTVEASFCTGTVIDVPNQVLYLFGDQTYPKILKFDLSNYSIIATLDLNSTTDLDPATGVIDSLSHFLYIGTCNLPVTIIKIDLSNFTKVESLLSGQDQCFSDSGIDEENGFVYFLGHTAILKLNLSDFSIVNLTLLAFGNCETMNLDLKNQLAFVPSLSSRISRIDLETLAIEETVFIQNYLQMRLILIDEVNQKAYVGFSDPFGLVAKIDLSTFEINGYLTSDHFEDKIQDGAIDLFNGFAYFFFFSTRYMKVRLSDFTIQDQNYLASGICKSVAFDSNNHFLYVGLTDNFDTPVIYKLSCPDLVVVDSFNLSTNVAIYFLKIDSSRGYLYSLIQNSQGAIYSIIKIRLSTFKQIGSMTLEDFRVDTMVVDSKHERIYIGTEANEEYGYICGISSTDMRFLPCYEIEGTIEFTSSFIESSDTYAFFFSYIYDETVNYFLIKASEVKTSSNEFVGNIILDLGFEVDISKYDGTRHNLYISSRNAYPVPFYQISSTEISLSNQEVNFSIILIILFLAMIFFE